MATDNSGHVIIKHPTLRPPVNLSIGLYSLHYSAKDGEGNIANCTFLVQVARRSCPVLNAPKYGTIASLSCGWLFGSQVSLSCNVGYHLLGSAVRSCKEDGRWSGNKTSCQIVTCTPLVTPPHAVKQIAPCPNTYGSSCTFSCQTGYTSPKGNVTRTCLASGKWSGGDINCTDIHPPTFGASCPTGPLVAYAERGIFSALVNWTEPVATDTSGIAPVVTSDYRTPQRFSQGSHVITYTAVDQSGNRATCPFTIEVLVINCTSLMVSPGGPLRLASCANHYGSKCNFSCATGYRLNGSSTVTCIAVGNRPPGFWDRPKPVCQVINCSALAAPANGAVSPRSCLSRSTYAQTCSFSCGTAGYVLEGTSSRVCGDDGKWSGKNDTLCREGMQVPLEYPNTNCRVSL
ncbi:sushi repeat-containing protein SRPX-like [Porites lutea]|uniref:sushi repeat-containing protein SRPX-like n=1 Tax=Porites lutea TaxID=51062 RepID=UPI003CC63101